MWQLTRDLLRLNVIEHLSPWRRLSKQTLKLLIPLTFPIRRIGSSRPLLLMTSWSAHSTWLQYIVIIARLCSDQLDRWVKRRANFSQIFGMTEKWLMKMIPLGGRQMGKQLCLIAPLGSTMNTCTSPPTPSFLSVGVTHEEGDHLTLVMTWTLTISTRCAVSLLLSGQIIQYHEA